MNNAEQLAALDTYFDLMAMNGAMRIFRAARQTGILASLEDGAETAAGIASANGLVERPTRLLLEALCSFGVTSCTGENYALTPVMQLLTGTYANLSDEYWDHLPTLLKTGEPIARMDSAAESETQYAKQVKALAWMMRPAAEAAAHVLNVGTSRHDLSILDVGAGSAIWSLTLAAHDPGAHVTAVDWPAVLAIAGGFATQMGLAERFTPLPGNYHDVTLPGEAFDVAIVANVTHIETAEGNRALFASIRDALRPGGELVVCDIMPGQPKGDLNRTLYALGLALRTERGAVFTPAELEALLNSAGFHDTTRHALPVTPHTMGMIVAKRG